MIITKRKYVKKSINKKPSKFRVINDAKVDLFKAYLAEGWSMMVALQRATLKHHWVDLYMEEHQGFRDAVMDYLKGFEKNKRSVTNYEKYKERFNY